MDITRIELSNGQILSSGAEGDAIVSLSLTRAVNSDQELTLGSVCAAMAEMELMVSGESPIHMADTFTLYRGQEKIGIFTAEKPSWSSAHRVKITAYDPVAKLDRDLSTWIKNLTPWPGTLRALAEAVCHACGVTLSEAPFPNQDFPAKTFGGKTLTGRRILGWIAQAAGRYCYADQDGVLNFGWYQPTQDRIGPYAGDSITAKLLEHDLTLNGISTSLQGDELTLSGVQNATLQEQNLVLQGTYQHHYFQGGLSLADYQTAPIEKVQIRQEEADVGTVWPDIGQANTYCITANPLLSTDTKEELLPIAQTLYEQLKTVSYTPCTVSVSAEAGFRPGQILEVVDSNGKVSRVYIMESIQRGSKLTLKCVGSATRDSISARNDRSQEALSGKLLRLQTDVEGLYAENADMAGKSAALSLTVEALESKVTAQSAENNALKTQLTTLKQDSDSLNLQVQTIREQGVERVITTTGYSFSEEGLKISRSGMEMENLLDHTGMYVKRNGQVILRANNLGVEANDVTVGNYLIVGNHARLEDYNQGTACFYLGGM